MLLLRLHRALLTTVCATLLTAQGAAAAENWPEFRGPHANGRADEANPATEWSETKHKWKAPIHGKGWASPVVFGEKVWTVTATEDGKKLSVIGIDRETGKVLHDRVVFEVEAPRFCHGTNSYASCTPAVEEGRVYVHFGSYGTACLDAKTAETIWERRDFVSDDFRGPGSSPILYDDLLIVNFDGFDFDFVVALDKATGQTVWKTDRNCNFGTLDGDMRKAYGTSTIIEYAGRVQLISSAAKYTFSYDPKSGAELWRAEVGGMNTGSRPLFNAAAGLVYVTTGDGGDGLVALKADGLGDVSSTHVAWKSKQVISKRPSQILIDDVLFVVSDEGVASTRDAKTGEIIWKSRLPGKYWASPVYAGGRVYLFAQDGGSPDEPNGVVLKFGRECEVLAQNRLARGGNASPAIAGDSLFVRTATHLYRIDP